MKKEKKKDARGLGGGGGGGGGEGGRHKRLCYLSLDWSLSTVVCVPASVSHTLLSLLTPSPAALSCAVMGRTSLLSVRPHLWSLLAWTGMPLLFCPAHSRVDQYHLGFAGVYRHWEERGFAEGGMLLASTDSVSSNRSRLLIVTTRLHQTIFITTRLH